MSASESLKWILDVDNKGAVKGFEKVGATAEKELGKAESKIDKLGGNLTKFGAGAMAFAGLAGAGLVALGTNASNAALEAGKFSDATGIAVEDASRWIEVAGDMGIETDTVEKSLGFMNKTLGNSPQKFRELGVDVVRAKDDTILANETFLAVVDRLNAIKDPAERAAAGAELLGRGWQGMAELIATGSGTLKTSLAEVSEAKITSPEELAKAKDFRAAIDQMKDAFQDLAINIGQGAMPVISAFATGIGTVADAFGKLNTITSGGAGTFLAIGTAVLGAAGAVSFITGKVITARDRFSELGTMFGRTGGAAKTAAVEIEASAVATEAAGNAATTATPKVEAFGGAQKAMALGGLLAAADIVGGIERVKEAYGKRDILDAIEANAEALEAYGVDWERLQFKVGEGLTPVDEAVATIEAAGGSMSVYGGVVVKVAGDIDKAIAAQKASKDATEDVNEATKTATGEVMHAKRIYGEYAEGMKTVGEATTITSDLTAKYSRERAEAAYWEKKWQAELEADVIAEDKAKEALENHLTAVANLRDTIQSLADLEAQRRTDALGDIDKQRGFEQTTRDLTVALDEYGKKVTPTADETARMAKETYDAALDFGTLDGAAEGSKDAIDRSITSLQGVADGLAPDSPLRAELLRYIEDLKKIPSQVTTDFVLDIKGKHVRITPTGDLMDDVNGHRAAGGPVGAGRSYLVGEKGPELLTMGASAGNITPNGALGGVNYFDFRGAVGVDGPAVERWLVRTLKDYKRRGGQL